MPFIHHLAKCAIALALSTTIFVAQASTDKNPATAGKVFGVLSLIGDRLDIVIATPEGGNNMSPTQRESLPMAETVFDDTVLGAIVTAVRRVSPDAELASINTRSPVLFEKHRTLFEERGNTIAIPEAIRDALKTQNATHLFLVTKRRDEASALFDDAITEARGKVEGLGFYLDPSIETRDGVTGRTGLGYIAPYAFFDIRLIDLASSSVIRRQKVVDSWPVASTAAATSLRSLWEALSAASKVRLVNDLIKREILRMVPSMLR